jgi:hypothetical protein
MATAAPRARSSAARSPSKDGKPSGEVVKTWAFDSVGTRKYALQIRKASNGNPCLKFVEGVPQPEGTFRKFHLTLWSEDFNRFFEVLDEVRQFMQENGIKTPPGHTYDPNRKPGSRWPRKPKASRGNAARPA